MQDPNIRDITWPELEHYDNIRRAAKNIIDIIRADTPDVSSFIVDESIVKSGNLAMAHIGKSLLMILENLPKLQKTDRLLIEHRMGLELVPLLDVYRSAIEICLEG